MRINDEPIRRLIGRNGSAMGKSVPADPNQLVHFYSIRLGGVAGRRNRC